MRFVLTLVASSNMTTHSLTHDQVVRDPLYRTSGLLAQYNNVLPIRRLFRQRASHLTNSVLVSWSGCYFCCYTKEKAVLASVLNQSLAIQLSSADWSVILLFYQWVGSTVDWFVILLCYQWGGGFGAACSANLASQFSSADWFVIILFYQWEGGFGRRAPHPISNLVLFSWSVSCFY
jgi:hypothetical protein